MLFEDDNKKSECHSHSHSHSRSSSRMTTRKASAVATHAPCRREGRAHVALLAGGLDGETLLGFEEAADAVDGAGFAEDDHAVDQRW